MSIGRLLLHGVRLLLAVVLAMQLVSVAYLVRHFDPDALRVSAMLPAALLLKAALVLANAGLLWWVQRRLARRSTATAQAPRDPTAS